MHIDILSLYPEYFDSPIEVSFLGRAKDRGFLSLSSHDLRHWGEGARRRVDDRCLGGGPGMLLSYNPIINAIEDIKKRRDSACPPRVLYMSPSGRKLSPEVCRHYSESEHVIILCGHYEGVDQRVLDQVVDDEISVCDAILTNGCLAALVFVDSVARFIPGVLGRIESVEAESFEGGLLEGPQYTLPRVACDHSVPDVLFTGDHERISAYRFKKSLEVTQWWRGDLYQKYWKRIYEDLSLDPKIFCFEFYVEDLSLYKRLFSIELRLPTWEEKGKLVAVYHGSALLCFIKSEPQERTQGVTAHLTIPSRTFEFLQRELVDGGESDGNRVSKRIKYWRRLGSWTLFQGILVCRSEHLGLTLVWKKC